MVCAEARLSVSRNPIKKKENCRVILCFTASPPGRTFKSTYCGDHREGQVSFPNWRKNRSKSIGMATERIARLALLLSGPVQSAHFCCDSSWRCLPNLLRDERQGV